MRKSSKSLDEVIVEDDEREVRVGVVVEAFGNKNDRTEEHRPSPEFGEHLALDANMADVFGVGWRRDGRDDFRECDGIVLCRGVDVEFDGLRIEVARRDVPVLPLALIHVELDCLTIRPVECLVLVQEGLNVVVAGRNDR